MTVLKVFLAAALLVVSSCNAAATVEGVPLQTCNSCVTAGQSLHRTLMDAAGSPRAMMKLQEEFCGSHPAAGQKVCGDVLQSGVPALSRKLSSPVQVGLTLTLPSCAASFVPFLQLHLSTSCWSCLADLHRSGSLHQG